MFLKPHLSIETQYIRESVSSRLIQNRTKITLSIALTIIGLALVVTTYAALTTSQNLGSTGGINVSASLGVYSDSACNTAITSVNWGNLTCGGTTSQTVYIKNTGQGVSLALSMNPSNWSPSSANNYMTLSWNQEGTRINPGQSVAAKLTLTASSSIVDVTNFNVQISITGTQ